MISTTKKKGRDTLKTFLIDQIFVVLNLRFYLLAQHESLLGPLALESDPKEERDSEGDEGGGNVHVGDGDVLPNHGSGKDDNSRRDKIIRTIRLKVKMQRQQHSKTAE